MSNLGLKPYTKQITQELGGINGYVNLNKKDNNIILEIPIISTTKDCPINFSLTYNYQKRTISTIFGNGMYTNFNELIKQGSSLINLLNYDGTKDVFTVDSEDADLYKNEETLKEIKKITSQDTTSGYYYLLSDKYGNEMRYDPINMEFPYSIKTKNNDSYTIDNNEDTIIIENKNFEQIIITKETNLITFVHKFSSSASCGEVNGFCTKLYLDNSNNISKIEYLMFNTGTEIFDVYKTINITISTNQITLNDLDTNQTLIYTLTNGLVTQIKNYIVEGYERTTNINYVSYYKTIVTNYDGKKVLYYFDENYLPVNEIDENGTIVGTKYNNSTKLLDNSFGPMNIVNDESNLVYNKSLNDFNNDGLSVSKVSSRDSDLIKFIDNDLYEAYGSGTLTLQVNESLLDSDVLTICMCVRNRTTYSSTNYVKMEVLSGYDQCIEHTFTNDSITSQYEFIAFSQKVKSNSSSITIKFTLVGGATIQVGNILLYKKSFGAFYNYDENKNLLDIDSGSISEQLEYDENNQVISSSSADSSLSKKEYNSNKQLKTSKEHYGVEIESEYSSYYNFVNKRTYTSPYKTAKIVQQQNYVNGALSTVTNYNLLNTPLIKKTNDIFGRLVTTTDLINNTIKYNIYDKDLLTKVQYKDEDNNYINYTYAYDSLKRLDKITCPNGMIYEFTYDNYSNIKTVKLNNIILESYEYDSVTNLMTKVTYANGEGNKFVYDTDLLLNKEYNVSANGVETLKYQYVYDDKKQLVMVLDSNSKVLLQYIYDCDGQVLEVIEENNELKYQYDNLNNLTNEFRTFNSKTIHQSYDTIHRAKGSNPENLDKYLQEQVKVLAATFINDANIRCHGHEIAPTYVYSSGTSLSFSCTREGIVPYLYLSSSRRLSYTLNIMPQTEIVTGSVGFWFKKTTTSTSKKYLFSTKSAYNSCYLGVYIENNYLYLESVDYDNESKVLCASKYPIEENKWNFFALDIQNRNDAGAQGSPDVCQYILFLNSHFTTYTQSNPRLKVYLDAATKYNIGAKYNGSTYSDFFEGKIASLYIGPNKYLGINNIMEYYKVTKDYLIDNQLVDADVNGVDFGVGRYTNFTKEDMENYKIFPFHNTVESLSGDKPKLFIQRTLSNIDKDRTFNFDKKLKDYVFVSDGNRLCYSMDFDTMGSILMKVLFDANNDKQYLFAMKDSYNKFGVYRDSDKKLCVEFNGNVRNSNIIIENDEWNNIAFTFKQYLPSTSTDSYGLSYTLYVNDTKYEHMVYTTSTINQVTLSIGANNTSTSINEALTSFATYYPLYGVIGGMIVKEGATLSKTNIDSLFDKMNETRKISIYDEFGMLQKTEIREDDNSILSNVYEYKKSSNGTYLTTDPLNEKIKLNGSTVTTRQYTTDEFGRITSVNDSIFGSNTYTYNSRGFLLSDKDKTYTYDSNGNILSNGNVTYSYTNGKLTKVGNNDVIYDSNNNSLIKQIGNITYTYEGNKLKMCYNTSTYNYDTYRYNVKGQRVEKLIQQNEVAENVYYKYSGNNLITEKRDNYRLDFLYDENNLLYGFIYNKTTKYFYIRDITGLILGIALQSGNIVVKYSYDSYGKILSINDTSGISIGTINPFRYKGYYYDWLLFMR